MSFFVVLFSWAMAQAVESKPKAPAKEQSDLIKLDYQCFRCLRNVHTWIFRQWPSPLARDCRYSLDGSFREDCRNLQLQLQEDQPQTDQKAHSSNGASYCNLHILYEYTPQEMGVAKYWLPDWWDTVRFQTPFKERHLLRSSHKLGEKQDAMVRVLSKRRTFYENELDLEHYNQAILDAYFTRVRWYRAQLKYGMFMCGALRYRMAEDEPQFAECVACLMHVYTPILYNSNYIHPVLQGVYGGVMFHRKLNDGTGRTCLCPFCMQRVHSKACEQHCKMQGKNKDTWIALPYVEKIMFIIQTCQNEAGKRLFIRWWLRSDKMWGIGMICQVIDRQHKLVQVLVDPRIGKKVVLDLESLMPAQYALFQSPPSGIARNSPVEGPKMFLESDFDILIDDMTQDDMRSKFGPHISYEWIIPIRRQGNDLWVSFAQIAHSKKLFLALQEKNWL